MANKTIMVASGTGPYRAAASGDTLVDGDGVTIGTGSCDRTLVFSDDTEFSETGTSFVTKKTFRVISDSDKPVVTWRFVCTVKVDAGATCTLHVAVGDHVPGADATSTSETYEVKALEVAQGDLGNDTPLTVIIQIKRTVGGTTAYLQYTDVYAVYA